MPALTMNNRNGVAIPVAATVGVLRHMEQRACRQYYTAAYQMSDFDDLKDILNSQGVTERNCPYVTRIKSVSANRKQFS